MSPKTCTDFHKSNHGIPAPAEKIILLAIRRVCGTRQDRTSSRTHLAPPSPGSTPGDGRGAEHVAAALRGALSVPQLQSSRRGHQQHERGAQVCGSGGGCGLWVAGGGSSWMRQHCTCKGGLHVRHSFAFAPNDGLYALARSRLAIYAGIVA